MDKIVENPRFPVEKPVDNLTLFSPCGKPPKLSTGYPQDTPAFPQFYPQVKGCPRQQKIGFSTVSTGPTTTTTIFHFFKTVER